MSDRYAGKEANIETMSSICGIDHVIVGDDVCVHGFSSDNRPQLLVSPGSVEELQEIVRWAASSGYALIALGGGSQINQVLGRLRPSIAVCTRRLDTISEFEPDNLSLCCGSGTLPAKIAEKTAPRNLQLPIFADAPHSTVGGLVAADFSGWKRYRYGAAGDYVLGLSFVSADGMHVSTGGRTVKNVSGYDFTRLMSGSWGRFGIITSITFKLLPRPQKELLVAKDFATPQEALIAGVGLLSRVADICSCNLIVDSSHAEAKLVLALEGSPDLVSSQLEGLQLTAGWRSCAAEDDGTAEAEEYVRKRQDVKKSGYHKAVIDKRLLAETLPLLQILKKYHCCYDFDLSAGLLEFSISEQAGASIGAFIGDWQAAVHHRAGIIDTLGFRADTSAMFARLLHKLDPRSIMFPDNLYSGGSRHD